MSACPRGGWMGCHDSPDIGSGILPNPGGSSSGLTNIVSRRTTLTYDEFAIEQICVRESFGWCGVRVRRS